MNRRALLALFLALISGAIIHFGDIYSPFRLRGLDVQGGTTLVESALRRWSGDFAYCWPKGLFLKGKLYRWASHLPLDLTLHWHPLRGRLTVNVASLRPKAKLNWRDGVYYLSQGGQLFSYQLASRYTTQLPEGLPELGLADDFPLVEKGQEAPLTTVALDPDWLLGVMDQVRTFPGLVATDLTLRRRGGEDLILCNLRLAEGGESIFFQGVVPLLDKTLAVSRRLLQTGETKGYALLDATYSNKVFLRPEGALPTK